MLTIIVMSQKGGTGESAIAAGIAVESMSARGGTFVIGSGKMKRDPVAT